jgi:glyoxylase-like metal-dependent hydrolase (beta-lactamase superfamily II)
MRYTMAEYEIYALKFAGPVTSSGALLMWLKDWEKVEKRNYYIWCIRGNGELVIVDTGLPPQLAKEKNLAGYVNPVEVLSRIDVKADEIRHVILTHIHWDHAGGVSLFPKATFYIQDEEYHFWLKDEVAERPPLKLFTEENSKAYLRSLEGTDRLVLLKGDREVLPGIECLRAPGHSIALQAVSVKTAKGSAIIGSDCAHVFQNYREDWPSAFFIDLVALMRTYEKLRARASSLDLIFPGHDPVMSERYPEVAEDVTKLV